MDSGLVLSPPTLIGTDTPPRIEASVENEPKPLTQPRTVRGEVQLATASLQRVERKSAVEMLSPRHTALLLPPTATEVQVLAVAFDPRANNNVALRGEPVELASACCGSGHGRTSRECDALRVLGKRAGDATCRLPRLRTKQPAETNRR